MWCMVRRTTCSCSSALIKAVRTSGPSERSNGDCASCRANRLICCSLSASGKSLRSWSRNRTGSAGLITCAACPPMAANTVRKTSWRRTISVRVRSRDRRSSWPVRRTAAGMLYSGLCGESWSKNHSRCWENDSGSLSPLGAGEIDGDRRPCSVAHASSIFLLRPATVGDSNNAATSISTLKASRTRDRTCVASNEWPPISKKSSCKPIRSSPINPSMMPATNSSVAPRGAACSLSDSCFSGASSDSAFLSILPLSDKGSDSSTTKSAGIIYSGSFCLR